MISKYNNNKNNKCETKIHTLDKSLHPGVKPAGYEERYLAPRKNSTIYVKKKFVEVNQQNLLIYEKAGPNCKNEDAI